MADLKPIFHHLNNSQSQRLLWLLEELEIPYTLKLHEREPSGPNKQRAPAELKQVHVLGKAPALETGDGRVIIESLAIARYLIDTYDTAGKFKGDGQSNDWLRDEELCNVAAASLGPLMNIELIFSVLLTVLPFFIKPLFNVAYKQLHKGYTGAELKLYFQYLNDQLGEQDYFMGTSPGRADFIMKWPVDNCVKHGFVNIKDYPAMEKWYARVEQRPGWKKSLERGNGYSLEIKI
ncbi:hypothetical protein B0A52_09532 [Exophiala mesophila]|uniref:Glutathione S-transferase n=1 Tax=Exophiala mesophila TaxID=212818 RepID=A0A438MV13_EXOME|nr:hypothetical protein B0A52_09532 [Exophiala mesophila]